MARSSTPEADPLVSSDDMFSDEDLSRVRQMWGDKGALPSGKTRMPPNPSFPAWQPQFDSLLPKIQANSSSREEFADNLRRVFEGLKKAGYQVEDVDGQIAKYLQNWPEFTPNTMQQNRRNELKGIEQDWLNQQGGE